MADSREAGFSLVEVLVSLALMALISLLLLQAIGTTGMLSRLGARLAGDTDLDIVRDHLRGSLGRLAGRGVDGRRPPFRGEPERYVATVLADRGTERGGEIQQTVWVLRRPDGTLDLVEARGLGAAGGDATPEVLVPRLGGLRLRYFGSGATDPQLRWSQVWTIRDRSPALVEVTLVFEAGDRRRWAPLLIPLGSGL